ncbi:MAG: hypothetical protein H7145_18535 [Akkermansiaceae bacterium]|nr:hypothetical protein [Armatimonadota bacterium]
MQYVQDYDETYPTCNRSYHPTDLAIGRASWMRHLNTYSKSLDIQVCPNAIYGSDTATGTGTNNNGIVIPGPNNDTTQTLRFTRRSLGVNRWVFMSMPPGTPGGSPLLSNPPANPYPVTESMVGRPADLTMVADSAADMVEQPWYITYANWNEAVFSTPSGAKCATSFMVDLALAARRANIGKYGRHQGGANIVYADGHAKWSKNEALNYNGATAFLTANEPGAAAASPNGVARSNSTIYGYNIPIAWDDTRLK